MPERRNRKYEDHEDRTSLKHTRNKKKVISGEPSSQAGVEQQQEIRRERKAEKEVMKGSADHGKMRHYPQE